MTHGPHPSIIETPFGLAIDRGTVDSPRRYIAATTAGIPIAYAPTFRAAIDIVDAHRVRAPASLIERLRTPKHSPS